MRLARWQKRSSRPSPKRLVDGWKPAAFKKPHSWREAASQLNTNPTDHIRVESLFIWKIHKKNALLLLEGNRSILFQTIIDYKIKDTVTLNIAYTSFKIRMGRGIRPPLFRADASTKSRMETRPRWWSAWSSPPSGSRLLSPDVVRTCCLLQCCVKKQQQRDAALLETRESPFWLDILFTVKWVK